MKIKALGRPTTVINLKAQVNLKTRRSVRAFNSDLFDEYPWLCACDARNAVFCFPCVLFGGNRNWAETGITDLQRIEKQIKDHSSNKVHITQRFKSHHFRNRKFWNSINREQPKSRRST